MATEIVDLAIENGDFSMVLLVYQRVYDLWLSSGHEGAIRGAFGVSIWPIYSLFHGEPGSLEFLNYLIDYVLCNVL